MHESQVSLQRWHCIRQQNVMLPMQQDEQRHQSATTQAPPPVRSIKSESE